MDEARDRQAVSLLRRRDPRGFDLAYAAYAARLRAFLLRLSQRDELTDDLLQQTFLRLAERGPELRADSDLRAWLFAVARNAFLSQARGFSREGDDAALEAIASPTPDVEARLLLGDLERALARLRLEDRELLLLVGVEGLAPNRVATMLGIEAAVRSDPRRRARRAPASPAASVLDAGASRVGDLLPRLGCPLHAWALLTSAREVDEREAALES